MENLTREIDKTDMLIEFGKNIRSYLVEITIILDGKPDTLIPLSQIEKKLDHNPLFQLFIAAFKNDHEDIEINPIDLKSIFTYFAWGISALMGAQSHRRHLMTCIRKTHQLESLLNQFKNKLEHLKNTAPIIRDAFQDVDKYFKENIFFYKEAEGEEDQKYDNIIKTRAK